MTVKQWFQRAHLPVILNNDYSIYDNTPNIIDEYIDKIVEKEGLIVDHYQEWSASRTSVSLTCLCLEGDELLKIWVLISWTFPFKLLKVEREHF